MILLYNHVGRHKLVKRFKSYYNAVQWIKKYLDLKDIDDRYHFKTSAKYRKLNN